MQHPASGRFSLPFLAQGQAQKELFHNEALTLLDFLVHPLIQSVASDPDILTPEEGQAWIVGPNPIGLWGGKENLIAGWSAGGWRFIVPSAEMQISLVDNGGKMFFSNSIWQSNADISEPDGGNNIDSEARDSIDSILAALRSCGILPS